MYLSEYRLFFLLSRQQDVMTALLLHIFTRKTHSLPLYYRNVRRTRTSPRFSQVTGLAGLAVSLVFLISCRSFETSPPGNWQTYRNPRYNFEFPYPSNWIAEPPPDNQDGQAFHDPQNSQAEIRGWAGHQIKPIAKPKSGTLPSLKPNFTTEQGLPGELQVNIGPEISSMKLVLEQGNIRYNWQGRSPSQQFDDYYRFFYYSAKQYRVPPPAQQP
jgi:hypothetical protein